MKSIRIALATPFCIGAALGQDMQDDDSMRVPEPLQKALSLTDDQIEELRANKQALGYAVRPLARNLSDT